AIERLAEPDDESGIEAAPIEAVDEGDTVPVDMEGMEDEEGDEDDGDDGGPAEDEGGEE
ncbi:MAG: hypothetical protein JO257_03970, partial [Deltaproteobacteria bacterium]|nr:hypothetical protein [Deltaproteobacteria bacterium]